MSFLDIDRAELGREYERATLPPISRQEIVDYARTLGVTDPEWLDETVAAQGPHGRLVALPSFVVRLRGPTVVPPQAAEEMRRSAFFGFDAGKDIELGVPIEVGDVITVSSRITDIYEKTGRSGSMVFLVHRSELHNQRGERVAQIDSRMMQKLPTRSVTMAPSGDAEGGAE